MRLAVRRWAGEPSRPVLYLAHATGFCKEVWEPVVEELRAAGSNRPVLAWDFRGHGGSDVPDPPVDWWDFARDVLAVAEETAGPRLGVGHSCGAAGLAMAEILRPGTFQALVLVEPIVWPPPYRRDEGVSLAEGAERRRELFPSREAVRESFLEKELFARWDSRALEGYLSGGFREDGDGSVRLCCPPAVEADIYRGATAHGAWERLPEVEVPVLILAGEESDSHPREFVERLAGRFPSASRRVVPGTGHFLPMERPGLLAEAVASFFQPVADR